MNFITEWSQSLDGELRGTKSMLLEVFLEMLLLSSNRKKAPTLNAKGSLCFTGQDTFLTQVPQRLYRVLSRVRWRTPETTIQKSWMASWMFLTSQQDLRLISMQQEARQSTVKCKNISVGGHICIQTVVFFLKMLIFLETFYVFINCKWQKLKKSLK